MPRRSLAPQLAALVNATAQIILQPIFDLESPRIAFGRVALIGDAAFVARPHVATGVMKAAIDAESLVAALSAGAGDVPAGLERYNGERQPYGASLVARGRHIGAYFTAGHDEPRQRIETLMREYGAAGIVGEQPIAARGSRQPSSISFDFQTASIVLAMRLHPSHSADALRKQSEGARDAGGPTDPRASASRDAEAERRSRPRSPSGIGRTASPPSLQRPARGV